MQGHLTLAEAILRSLIRKQQRTTFDDCYIDAMIRSLILALFATIAAASPPNIIVIVSDDHRADVMGCAGHPIVQTPALDELAAQGVQIEDSREGTRWSRVG